MGKRADQLIIQSIIGISAAVLIAVLAAGIVDGRLLPGASDRASALDSPFFGGSSGSFDDDSERGVLLVSQDGYTIRSVDPADGTTNAEITLENRIRSVVPTPGGVSVWLTFEDRPGMQVYSTTDLEHEATIEPEGSEDRVAEHLLFSENGDTLFVTWQDSDNISVYRHQMRELSLRMEIEAEGTRGPVYRNRRATRLFRATEDGDIALFFAQNGQRIGTIAGLDLAEAPSLAFNSNHTEAWAATSSGRLAAFSEQESTGGIVDTSGVAAGIPPVFFDRDNRAVFVGNSQRSLMVFEVNQASPSGPGGQESDGRLGSLEPRSQRGIDGIEVASFAESAHSQAAGDEDLERARVIALLDGGSGRIIAVTDNGILLHFDANALEPVSAFKPAGNDGRFAQAVMWTIQAGGNFACF